MSPFPSLIRLGLRALTLGLPLWPTGSGFVRVPPRYHKVPWKGPYPAETPFRDPLVRFIQIVLGSEELAFGEGGVCSGCGALLPLREFEDKVRAQDPHCSECGRGLFGYCYPTEILGAKLRFELMPECYHEPVLFLMMGQLVEREERLPLIGAAWGATASVPVIQAKLKTRFGSKREELRRLGDKLRFLGYEEPEKLMFVDEFLVHRHLRENFEPPVFLARLLFEHALENGVTAVLVWTKPRWPFTPFWKALGFGEIFRIGDFRFLLNEDIRPALRLFQNKGVPGYMAWQFMISWLPGLSP